MNKQNITNSEILLFMLGLFTSIAIIKVDLGFIQLTPYNFLLYIFAIKSIVSSIRKKCALKKDLNFLSIIFCLVISCIINCNLPNAWVSANVTMTINYTILGVILLSNSEDFFAKHKSAFVKGLWVNSWIQLVWGTLQFALYRLFNGMSLNQLIFGDILHISGTNYTMTYWGLQRITGLHWECAYYALALTIGMLLSTRKWQQFMFFIGVLLSTSRTGIVTAMIAIILMIIMKCRNGKIRLKIRITNKTIIIYGIFLCIIMAVLFSSGETIYNTIVYNVLRFKGMNTDSSAIVHMSYYRYLPDILLEKFNVLQLLFGIGSGSSGYVYAKYYDIYSTVSAWTIENEFANQLVGNGILGTFAVYSWIIKRIMKCRSVNEKSLLCAIIISGLSYSYLVNWVWLVIFILSVQDFTPNDIK